MPPGQHGTHSERGDKRLRRSRTLQRALLTVIGCSSSSGCELRSVTNTRGTLSGGHLNIAQIMRAAAGQHGDSHVAHHFSALCSGARPKAPAPWGMGASSHRTGVTRYRARQPRCQSRDRCVDPQRLKRQAGRARRSYSASAAERPLRPDASEHDLFELGDGDVRVDLERRCARRS